MPRDSNGIYTLPNGYLAVSGTTIQPSQHNPPLEDVATALTNSLPRDGAAPMTDALKLTDGSAAAPALRFNSAAGRGMHKTTDGIGFSIGGTLAMEIVPTGIKLSGGLWVALNDFEVRSANPSVWMHSPGAYRMRMWMTSDGVWRLRADGAGEDRFRVHPDGSVWTAETGPLTAYVWSLANTLAWTAANSKDPEINDRVNYMRFTGGGDFGWSPNAWGGGESGHVINGVRWNVAALIDTIRIRYLQYYKPNTGWVTVGDG